MAKNWDNLEHFYADMLIRHPDIVDRGDFRYIPLNKQQAQEVHDYLLTHKYVEGGDADADAMHLENTHEKTGQLHWMDNTILNRQSGDKYALWTDAIEHLLQREEEDGQGT
jgi:hypothetical protein